MAYLADVYGRFTLSGVYSYDDARYVQKGVAGEVPGDHGRGSDGLLPYPVARGTNASGTVERLIEAAGGSLVTISWHWNAPAGLIDKELVDDRGNKFNALWYKGFNSNATNFDVAERGQS